MEAVEKKENPWFIGAESRMKSIACILIELNRRGAVDEAMKEAILKHSDNSIDDLAGMVRCSAMTLAAAHAGDGGMDEHETAIASWGIAFMAEALEAMIQLKDAYDPATSLAYLYGQQRNIQQLENISPLTSTNVTALKTVQ
jgi:hypothetical protein